MHLPDGFLAPQVALALWLLTAVIVGIALRRLAASRDATAAAGRPILMGLVGAFIFAAQMFNFPVAAGTSGHLLGGVLAGYLLGPWAGTIVMTTVVGVQALLFQDGGLLALGANIFNMGIIGTLGGTLIARALAVTLGDGRSARIGSAGVAGWLSVMAGAGVTSLELGLSGTIDISVGLPAMLGVHALIGVGEALITIAALTFIATTAPDLLGERSAAQHSLLRRAVAGFGAAFIVVGFATLFTSTNPDGLNFVAQSLGFSGLEAGAPFKLFAGYAIPGLDETASFALSGFVGVIFIAGLLLGLSRLAASRTSKK